MKTRQSGFTLMELLTTVVLAGIVLAFAVPSYSRFVASSRVVDRTNELIGALTLGRSESIKRNANVTLCRAANASTTACANSVAAWEFWILRTPSGTVLRRGAFNTYDNTLRVASSLAADSVTFGADGLARTGGALVNAADDDSHFLTICSTKYSHENRRVLTLGASSRITTTKESGTCS